MSISSIQPYIPEKQLNFTDTLKQNENFKSIIQTFNTIDVNGFTIIISDTINVVSEKIGLNKIYLIDDFCEILFGVFQNIECEEFNSEAILECMYRTWKKLMELEKYKDLGSPIYGKTQLTDVRQARLVWLESNFAMVAAEYVQRSKSLENAFEQICRFIDSLDRIDIMIDDFNIQDVMHATWQHVSAITDKKADDLVQSIRSQRIKTEIQKQVSESLERENADTIIVERVMPETELESVDLPLEETIQERILKMDTKEKISLVFGPEAALASFELKQFITKFDEHKWFLIRLATIQLNVAAFYCMQNQSSVKNLYHYLFEFSQLAFGFQARLAASTLEQSYIEAKLNDAIKNHQNFSSEKDFDAGILDFIFEN